MPFYVGIGKNCHEIRFDEITVRLWLATVNGQRYYYRGTEQAVLDYVADRFYWEDWHVAPYKFLALSSEIIDLTR